MQLGPSIDRLHDLALEQHHVAAPHQLQQVARPSRREAPGDESEARRLLGHEAGLAVEPIEQEAPLMPGRQDTGTTPDGLGQVGAAQQDQHRRPPNTSRHHVDGHALIEGQTLVENDQTSLQAVGSGAEQLQDPGQSGGVWARVAPWPGVV